MHISLAGRLPQPALKQLAGEGPLDPVGGTGVETDADRERIVHVVAQMCRPHDGIWISADESELKLRDHAVCLHW